MAHVVACCPAKNRAWILPAWYAAMRAQTRPVDAAIVLLNDCTDDSFDACVQGAFAEEWRDIPRAVVTFNTGDPGTDRIAREGVQRYSIANLAIVRNELVRRVLERYPQATHLWSCDSDVLPDPDALEKLLAADLPVVAAVVRNSEAHVWNFFTGRDADGPRRYGRESAVLAAAEPQEVTMTGACVLIQRAVAEAARYSGHPRGEDVAWSQHAHDLGVGLYVHPLARTAHHMSRGEEPLR